MIKIKTEIIKKTGITSNAMAKMGRKETVQLDVLKKFVNYWIAK